MTKRGFTLFEVIIYIALLSMLMTGALAAAWALLGSSGQSNDAVTADIEESFVMQKILRTLTEATTTPTVSGAGCTTTLALVVGADHIVFKRDNDSLEMGENGSFVPLTAVGASCLQFSVLPPATGVSWGVAATTTIGGETSGLLYYENI